jgi:uncharacterized protein
VDIVAEIADGIIPFEVKYTQNAVGPDDLTGLRLLCQQRNVARAYVITGDMADFNVFPLTDRHSPTDNASQPSVLKIPAPLACYWLSQSEYGQSEKQKHPAT